MISDNDLERYSRQIIIPEFDEEGQEFIQNSKILIVGAGGLGCSTSIYCAAAGFGAIDIIDYDIVDITNLNRQIAYSQNDIGKFKSKVLKKACLKLNPNIKINSFYVKFDLNFFIGDYDIVIDCSDNIETRYHINQLTHTNKKTFIHGSATQFEGQMGIFKSGTNNLLPCYECLFPVDLHEHNQFNCREAGIIGSVTNFISSLQVTETIRETFIQNKHKTNSSFSKNSMSGNIFLYNGLEQELSKIKIKKNNKCKICG